MHTMRVLLLLAAVSLSVEGWSLFGGDDTKDAAAEGDAADAEVDADSTKVVGARIETCRGCRLNYLPRVRNFIQHIAEQFPALSVKYIQGAPPDVLWLNEFGQEVGREHLDDYNEKGIENLLKKKGITRKTSAPSYRARRFKPTQHCLAFRATDMCGPKEARVLSHDLDCNAEVPGGRAGQCECKGGVTLAVECGERDQLKLTCEELCGDIIDGEFLMAAEA